ncbi:carboxymuconolactone decarboxylase family protein [Citrobacter sp. JGM124]|uniref:carboxymuconolactone decarboxylase family protein n=1 Tax=Citrobacter sp. JGM124 TaxID=2799789 RepID=UPI001BA96720|nr:carboxymuconolactone decarboxylase family protein [Citrobacter sp. JGM124]MBS0850008.1 carboxymuconolactone decarboxylase family protein [Citrobacter sp. JGM124]
MTNTIAKVTDLDKTQHHTKNFRTLSTDSWHDGSITSRDKHLIAVAIAQATNCKHCLLHHAHAAKQDGATFDHIAEISYLTGIVNIAGERLLELTDGLTLPDDSSVPLARYTSTKVIDYINQQLKESFITLNIKILALLGIAKYKGNTSLVEHLLTLAKNNQIHENEINEALLVVDILSTGIIYSNNQDIYQYLSK